LKPGDRLPSVREMAERWGCTIGTVQHAYHELVQQGLLTSRSGQGTRVVDNPHLPGAMALRQATLTNRAEAFLLETLTAGHSLEEVERAFRLATDRWRQSIQDQPPPIPEILRFIGSHDLVMTWLASHFPEIAPGYGLQMQFAGSLGGLIALAEGRADLAGSHLWDEESDTYNIPFVRRVLPGQRVALLTLAQRRIGLILPEGNPVGIASLADLLQPGLRFINRQAGSGTRVWLDAAMSRAGLPTSQIAGYQDEKITHSAVAQAVAEGKADVGIGLEAAALSYNLDFLPLAHDQYDLVIPEAIMALPAVQALANWLIQPDTHAMIEALGGYDVHKTGQINWIG
jgi:molybdate-binding protein/DNA-binding transcriptional regulator YhcF (GntR family)